VTEVRADAPVAFAPEAHLPQERRLVVDTTGLVLETGFGVRHMIAWTACRAVLVWRDRVELLVEDEVSIVVRATEWHRGARAVQAISERAPAAITVAMPDDPEPVPARYVLRGLATSSGAVLVLLAASLALVAVMGIGIGIQDRRAPALVLGALFAVAAGGVLRSLVIRLRVPARWRASAAVRGRTPVAIDSKIARSSDPALAVAEPALFAAAGLVGGVIVLVVGSYNLLPAVLILGVAFAVRRERRRRVGRIG
jgi:hypothetical protein